MIAFKAHKNFVAQSGFKADVYNDLSMPYVQYDEGDAYTESSWTPIQRGQQPRSVVFSGQIWVGQHGTGNPPIYVCRISKNGLEKTIGAQISTHGTFVDSQVIVLSMQDIAQADDVYRLYLYVTNPAAMVDGHPLHTWWCGTVI